MLVDTHAHINLHAFSDDANEVLQRSFNAGVAVINVGTEYNTSRHAVELLKMYPENVYAVIGLHPSHTYENPHLDENESVSRADAEHFDTRSYRSMAQHPRVVGIGECGLDYYRLSDPNNTNENPNDTNEGEIKKLQKDAFMAQLQLAQELDKALVIHCRPSKETNDAYEDILEILKTELSSPRMRGSTSAKKPTTWGSLVGELDSRLHGNDRLLRFEVHSFTGSLEIAQKFLELGAYIGLNGIITFDKTGNMEQVVKGVPLERIVLETDSPYLAPVPNRGKRNEPANVVDVAKKIAEWKSIGYEEVAEVTTANARSLFRL